MRTGIRIAMTGESSALKFIVHEIQRELGPREVAQEPFNAR